MDVDMDVDRISPDNRLDMTRLDSRATMSSDVPMRRGPDTHFNLCVGGWS